MSKHHIAQDNGEKGESLITSFTALQKRHEEELER